MSLQLFFKVLRDIRWPLFFVGLLLLLFQLLWAKITHRITDELVPFLKQRDFFEPFVKVLFAGPGRVIQSFMGGETIRIDQPFDMLTIGYVHPVMQIAFCVWAIGRASGALAGEIDKGTMELLLAQPVTRRQVVLSHFSADLVLIPILCACLIAGNCLGLSLIQLPGPKIELARFPPALLNVAALIFAVSGYTLAISSLNRFRWRAMSWALGITLVMFLVNVLGQLWDVLAPWRPLTAFYYYQPQQIILKDQWLVPVGPVGDYWFQVNGSLVLLGVGLIGYAAALAVFTRRDLPAPL